MADNFPLTPGSGRSAATDQVTYSGDTADVQLVRVVQVSGTEGSKTVDTTAMGKVGSNIVMCQTTVTRPADTTAYAANDAMSDSTTTPTTGGFTFTGAAIASGGAGIITDLMVTSSNDPATQLQGELFIFDRAVTNINDNAAFAVTDAEIQTCVAKIPFTLEDVGNNGFYHAQNLNIGFVCNGSANLRFLVRVKNAYTPASAEVVTFTLKVMQA